MDAGYSVAVYVIIDDTMGALGHRSHPLAGVGDAEVLTVAVVAPRYVGNQHARMLAVLEATELGDPLYSRLGFTKVGSYDLWLRPR